MTFSIDRKALKHERVTLIDDVIPINEHLHHIDHFIDICFVENGFDVVQKGRVIALRHTDRKRLVSAFKSAIYLGKYQDMDKLNRFLKNMVSAGHSYEPIRGELVLFLFIGVGKPVYDHLVTYTTGRPTRIAGGQRANLPWGYEVPAEVKHDAFVTYSDLGVAQVKQVIETTKGLNEETEKQQIQAARSLLPVGFVMPPFLMEFSEEALIKTVFKQRIFEPGAQGATVDIVKNMWDCMMEIDTRKWAHLFDYHGPHIDQWEKAMRTLRDKDYTFYDIVQMYAKEHGGPEDEAADFEASSLYDLIMGTVGKAQKSMWDK